MKKTFIISCVLVTSLSAANQPQKSSLAVQNQPDHSFYAQCIKPNIDALQKKYKDNKPSIDKHKKIIIDYHNEISKTNEYAVVKSCLGIGLLTDFWMHRDVYNRSGLRNLLQVIAGLYLTAPLVKQVYNDVLKKK